MIEAIRELTIKYADADSIPKKLALHVFDLPRHMFSIAEAYPEVVMQDIFMAGDQLALEICLLFGAE